MHSRLEKPIIREERAETSLAAFIKLGFSIARSYKWETQEQVFEKEGLIINLSLKRGSLREYKDYYSSVLKREIECTRALKSP